jgi:hypothetical protein
MSSKLQGTGSLKLCEPGNISERADPLAAPKIMRKVVQGSLEIMEENISTPSSSHVLLSPRTQSYPRPDDMRSEGTIYQHSSLEGPVSIRLIGLGPDEDDAPIECRIFHYSLQKSSNRAHLYEALSYVWGDPLQTCRISLNGQHFDITANLHAALLHPCGIPL